MFDRIWRHAALAVLASLLLAIYLYRETAVAMVEIWHRSETFTHGFIVVPIVLWLVWRKRAALAQHVPRPHPWLLPVVAGLALMWLLGDLVAVNSITQLALVALLVSAIPVLLGLAVAQAIMFPLAFMFFAVPIGEFIMPQLMDWTADFTILALRASGIPVYREGLNFVIPSGNWSVVEACSGVRYLIASVTVGTLYAYLNYQSTRRRLMFVLVSILVPIVANWVRAYMIVMLGHLSGNKIAVGVDHLIYGWVFFGVVIFLMFVIGSRWAEHEPASPAGALPHPSPSSAAANHRRIWMTALVFSGLLVMPFVGKLAISSNQRPPLANVAEISGLSGGWQLTSPGDLVFKPHFQNPDAERNDVFGSGARTVGVYLAYYRNQDYDNKLVSSSNVLVAPGDDNLRRVSGGSRSVELNGRNVTVRSAELRRLAPPVAGRSDRIVAWRVYWIDGTLTSSDHVAKVLGALYQILGRGDESAAIVVYTEKSTTDNAHETLAAFLAANYGAIDAALRKTRDGG